MQPTILFALLFLGLHVVASANPVYTWVDTQGVTHYAQTPPVADTTPLTIPARVLNSDSFEDANGCQSSLCEEVLTVDPYCRSSTCTRANQVEDSCFSVSCQNLRRHTRSWIAKLLSRSDKIRQTSSTAPF